MGIDSLFDEDDIDDNACPECDVLGEETEHWYWRCINNDCDVITYML